MTPPIKSVSDERLKAIAVIPSRADDAEISEMAAELWAVRRAANTPVSALPERCPECGLHWGYTPPTIIAGTNQVRCIECKNTFTDPGVPLSSGEVPEGATVADAPVDGDIGECRYCANTGWFYGDPDLQKFCGCAFGKLRKELSASPALPSQGAGVSASELAKAYLRGVEWRDENPGHVDYAYRFKAAGDYADKTTSCLTSPAAEPVARPSYNAISTMVHACRERQKQAGEGDQMLSRWISEGLDALYTHPAPSASREVTDDLRLAFRNADESDWKHLFAVLPDTGRGRFWKAVLTEVRSALLAALPEREG